VRVLRRLVRDASPGLQPCYSSQHVLDDTVAFRVGLWVHTLVEVTINQLPPLLAITSDQPWIAHIRVLS
jgi:hypothetical protein